MFCQSTSAGYPKSTQGTLRDCTGRIIAELRHTHRSGRQLASYEYMGSGRVVETEFPQPAAHQHADDNYEIWYRFGRTLQAY